MRFQLIMMQILLLIMFAAIAASKNTYIVLCPTTIRPGIDFEVNVHILKSTGDVTVTLELTKSSSKSVIASSTASVPEGQPMGITLKIPADITSGSYKLKVAGSGGLIFKDETTVTFNSKSVSLFIQTDKAMYKPGQTVNFRAFGLYPNLKLYTGKMKIDMYDSKSNKIKQWTDIQTTHGVYSDQLGLSDQPVLGDWKIKVTAGNMNYEQTFTVAEYVLPKFEVTVTLPPFSVTSDANVPVKINAKYTYGKPVKGNIRLEAKLDRYYRPWRKGGVTTPDPSIIKTAKIDGETEILLSMKEIKALNNNINSRSLEIVANVTEDLTGIVLNGTGSVRFYDKAEKVEFLKSNPNTFKPGLKYTAYIKVSQPDGRPVVPSNTKLQLKIKVTKKEKKVVPLLREEKPKLRVTNKPERFRFQSDIRGGRLLFRRRRFIARRPRPYEPTTTTTYYLPTLNLTVPDNGLVVVEVEIPTDAISIYMKGTYKDVSAAKSISKMHSPSNSYIQVSIRTSHISTGSYMSFEVKSTQTFHVLIYQILSRGTIVEMGRVRSGSTRTNFFTIPATHKMAPNARIVVYYVRADGEVVVDSISFDVDGAFENNVSISMSKTEAQPGDKVGVQVAAEPYSQVHLLAVDQSVLLLKSGNDITQAKVLNALQDYDTIDNHWGPRPIPFGRFKRKAIWGGWYPVYYGGSDASQVLRNAGVLVMTDATVYRHRPDPPPCPFCDIQYGEPVMMKGDRAPMAEDQLAGTASIPDGSLMAVGRVRKLFPEQWLWFNATAESAGGGPRPMFAKRGRPMLAKKAFSPNIAESVPKQDGSLVEVGRVRKIFPEQWMWFNATADFGGRAMFDTTVPDTITSWVATAFAVSNTKGFGVTPGSANLNVFRPFFVSLNLPYSITRGEQVVLQVLVFNYLSQDVTVLVKLPKSADYKNIIIDANGLETTVSETQVDNIRVKAGEARSVYFPIIPTKLGYVDIQVSGQTNIAADAVKRQILVEAEGIPMEYNQAILIDLKKVHTFQKSAPITFPPSVVDGSQRVVVTAIGDLMGSSLNGLDNLLRMPTGCGEQNMLNFAPNVFIVNYLKATGQYDGEVVSKAVRFMEKGYQRELTYQHSDGSFSAFGDSDSSGSMWLTAFVVKIFHQAKPHIFIDDKLLVKAINWMINQQDKDGSFPEPGRIIHKAMQGGSASGTSLTAFVLISLLENEQLNSDIQKSIQTSTGKAVSFLESKINAISDDYTLAITCYALQLAQSPAFSAAFERLKSHAIIKDGLRHWHKIQTTQSTKHYWNPPHKSNAIDTEMTSYALLVYADMNDVSGGLDILKWVIAQRNPHGGFASTQDTVLALQAISLYAKLVYSNTFDVQITFQAGTFTKTVNINKDNALVLQSTDLPSIPTKVDITATGHGLALVEVSTFFNVKAEVEEPSFELTVKIQEETTKMLKINTCARWLKEGSSGMVVEEIGVPSGFSADKTSIGDVLNLKRIETADKKIILYFDEIGRTAVCLNVDLHRTGLVVKTQPAAVTVYDYYEPSNKAVAFYQSTLLKNTKTCDVCPDCPGCKITLRR